MANCHNAAAAKRSGLTQALGLMTKFLVFLVVILVVAGCSGSPQVPITQQATSYEAAEEISLERAQELILSRQVREIFQPHVGPVVLTLKDGRRMSFHQPHLDWVVRFRKEHGVNDVTQVVE